MAKEVSTTVLYEVLGTIEHPDIPGRNLVELGMVSDIVIGDSKIHIILALPLPGAPIKEALIELMQEAIADLNTGLEIEVTLTGMAPKQRAAFIALARGEQPAPATRQIDHVVAVMSGKGGVGKSSVTGLLASELRRRGLEVGVLDADITGSSIPRIFGAHTPPTSGSKGILPVESRTGIKLMSINLLLAEEDQAVVWRGPLISRAIEQFWHDIAWGDLDYLIVDLPPGTSDAALTVTQSLPLDGVVLVTSPQDLAGMVVRKAAQMTEHLGIPLIGLVENMSHVTCPNCGATIEVFGPSQSEETARQISADMLGRVPLDPDLAMLCDAGSIEDYNCEAFEAIVDQVLLAVPARASSWAGSSKSVAEKKDVE
jgi:Mrp family chromosome partitioning ATPase